ncbi:hypothetical protein [Pseudomonas sp. SCB32]|uniref:hypothetical protein n=1 Tax=Pseudomonas sp. SCB32 TaxID=2653853 RepID=UPI001265029B|nr:hypothetical protein [Pseudomonas sp. SCB32]
MSTPHNALAMGGEGMAADFLMLALWVVIWFIACTTTVFIKAGPGSTARYVIWVIRLSLPVWIALNLLYALYVDPFLSRLQSMRRKAVENEYMSLCEQYTPQATKILKTLNVEPPRNVFVDDDSDGSEKLELYIKLAECLARPKDSSCNGLSLDFIDWKYRDGLSYPHCKNGAVPNARVCLPELKRYELAGREIKIVDIEKPASNYIIRVNSIPPIEQAGTVIDRFRVALETREPSQLLAESTILYRWQAPCPKPEAAAAKMLLGVFPQK